MTLSAMNWCHEKTEGLALVGPREVALINDNDIGVVTEDGKAHTELLRVTFDKDFTTMPAELRQNRP